MGEEKDAFYVARKGDVIGVYESFTDCHAQIGSSTCDPPVSLFKGYRLSKEAERHLKLHGLKNATYSVSASDVKADTLGKLVPCPYQLPTSSGKALAMKFAPGKKKGAAQQEIVVNYAFHEDSIISAAEEKNSCIIEFDGASKGNPGQAGAGAVIRAANGAIYRLREGVGFATGNVAEYRALILGLKFALRKGFSHVSAYGDSQFVCRQIAGLNKTENTDMVSLSREANELKTKFQSFTIQHYARKFNSEADAEANLAVDLGDGEVEEDLPLMH